MFSGLKEKLLWLLGGFGITAALTLACLLRRRSGPSNKEVDLRVDAAVEKAKSDAVVAEPVPTDINEVKKKLRERGLIR